MSYALILILSLEQKKKPRITFSEGGLLYLLFSRACAGKLAQTGINSIMYTDMRIGETSLTLIDMEMVFLWIMAIWHSMRCSTRLSCHIQYFYCYQVSGYCGVTKISPCDLLNIPFLHLSCL